MMLYSTLLSTSFYTKARFIKLQLDIKLFDIRILNILFRRKEATITDLEIILNFTQTKTSRHVNYLKSSGLLNFRYLWEINHSLSTCF